LKLPFLLIMRLKIPQPLPVDIGSGLEQLIMAFQTIE